MKKIFASVLATISILGAIPNVAQSSCLAADDNSQIVIKEKKVSYVTICNKNGAVITDNGDLYTWGDNWVGQLGDGTTNDSYSPKKILENIKYVDLDGNAGAAITNDDELYTWGYYWGIGNVGIGTSTEPDGSRPKKVLDNVKYVDVNSGVIYAITNDKSLYIWGDNGCAQLGNGTTDDSLLPNKILDNVAFITANVTSCAAITENGELYTWGANLSGQLGNGTLEHSLVPTKIMDNVKDVTLCTYHSSASGLALTWGEHYGAAITNNGELYTWGSNKYGQLGDGTNDDSYSPKKIMENIADVNLNEGCSAAITEEGELYTWGELYSTDENGKEKSCNTPTKIFDNVKSVSVGLFNALITVNDELYTWGTNYYGELGNGTIEAVSIPTKIMDNIKINCHYNTMPTDESFRYSAVVSKDGDLYTWGNNWYGYLGNGTTEDCIVPTKITIIDKSYSLGDITGDEVIDSSDASKVLMVYALISTGKDAELTIDEKNAADVNKDEAIDASDSSLILAYYAFSQTGGTGSLEEYLNS